MVKLTVAEQKGLSPECVADNSQHSASYWQHEQEYLCNIVRQMAYRCQDRAKYPELYQYCNALNGDFRKLAYPNVCITVAPAEWMFPPHL